MVFYGSYVMSYLRSLKISFIILPIMDGLDNSYLIC